MHRGAEPSLLQSMALQLADKVTNLHSVKWSYGQVSRNQSYLARNFYLAKQHPITTWSRCFTSSRLKEQDIYASFIALLSPHQGLKIEIYCTLIALFLVFEVCGYIHRFHVDLRVCLHGVGNPGLVGLVSFVSLWGHKTRETYPLDRGPPLHVNRVLNASCLPPQFCITIVTNFSWVLQLSQEKSKTMVMQNFGGRTRCIMVYGKIVNCIICVYYSTTLFRDFR